MSDSFGDLNSAARMRETVRAMVRETLAIEHPTDIFAIVTAFSHLTAIAEVSLPGSATSFPVPVGGIFPLVGALVRLGGKPGRYRVTSIVQGADVALAYANTRHFIISNTTIAINATVDLNFGDASGRSQGTGDIGNPNTGEFSLEEPGYYLIGVKTGFSTSFTANDSALALKVGGGAYIQSAPVAGAFGTPSATFTLMQPVGAPRSFIKIGFFNNSSAIQYCSGGTVTVTKLTSVRWT